MFGQTKHKEVDSIEIYNAQNELIKAINYAKKKADVLFENQEHLEYCKLCIQKSKIYRSLNDTEKSLSILYDVLFYAEKNHLKNIKTEIYLNIATNYTFVYDTIRAKKYYSKTLINAQKNNDLINSQKAIQNLFRLTIENNLDSAYYFMIKKQALDKVLKDEDNYAVSYNNFFIYYSKLQDKVKAKKYLDSSWIYAQKSKDLSSTITTAHNLSYHYLVEEKNLKKGIEILKDLEKKYSSIFNNMDKIDVYSTLAYAYEELKDYKNANFYNSLILDIKDKVYEEGLKSKIRSIETKYAIEKTENEYLTKQKALEEKQIKNQKIIIVFIALFAFSLILFYFFYQNLQLKQRNKIKELDSEVQENLINASIDGQEIERKKLASVLHDNISALLSSAGLQLSAHIATSPTSPSEEIIKARGLLKEAHDIVRDLSHELIPPVLAKLGLYYAIQDLCEKNSNAILHFNYNLYIPERKRFNEDFEIKTYFIIAELFNNIIKHSEATEAHITIEEKNGFLAISIEDNGKGFEESKTQISDGFGLTQIRARVKNLQGKFFINSKINTGTFIFIKIKTLTE